MSAEKGFIPSVRGRGGLGINEAIEEMIHNADVNEQTRKEYVRRANSFLERMRDEIVRRIEAAIVIPEGVNRDERMASDLH